MFHRILSEDRPVFEPRQRNLIALLSVISSLNTAIGKANVAVPATFDQVRGTRGLRMATKDGGEGRGNCTLRLRRPRWCLHHHPSPRSRGKGSWRESDLKGIAAAVYTDK